MTQRTRSFLFGSALVVAIGLCTGLVAYYSGNLPLRSSAIGPADLAWVPADVRTVAYADVRNIMDSEFRQRLREVLPTGGEKDRLLEETGIDVERDIDSVVAGFGAGEPDAGEAVVLVRGRFDVDRIETLAAARGATVAEYGGKRVFALPPAEDGRQRGPRAASLAVLEPGLLAFGGEADIRRAIDAAGGGRAVTGNADLMQLVGRAAGTGNAWMVSHVDSLPEDVPLPIQDRLSSVQWFWITAQIDRSVRGQASIETDDEAAASELRDVVNGALATARMFAGRDPRLEGVINSLQATGTGTSVELSFVLPVELLDVVKNLGPLRNAVPGMTSPSAH